MRKQGQTLGVKALIKQRRTLSSHDPTYPGFRRLRYIRYADDVRHITKMSDSFYRKGRYGRHDLRVNGLPGRES
jgi:hypothetical protein